ncbi:PadR family transcriptional regulator [Asanoa ishikariensis]|uniref:Transcriptional regulator, PadR family n=1 Tax=Asanoa ishikariensis TaxID=137265 RepID=A0A1H3RQX2_9ACTN|nr:PadR family transcriptional regulator [Asanoa ishikariensis]GIF66938.1 PadR family transcriptional regulator [Asanoa ishikariensis]SDZ28020.1 transcriptional regulator, PadR family [Asanoa ishikariensis]
MPPRKISNLLALAVLATLIERPMHPYEMASLMKARGKEQDMEIKWGSLYRVVENLVKHGFVEPVQSERQGGRPERTVYRITDAGRAELVDWTRDLVAVPDRKPGPFTAGLSVLGVLAPDDVAVLLGRRADLLASEISAAERALAGYEIPRLFLVEGEYELAMRRAELAWVRAFRAELTDGTLPGVADWRAYHETGEPPPDIAELAARGKEESR